MAYYKKNNGNIVIKFIQWKVKKYEIVLFAKSYSPEGQMCDALIRSCKGISEDNYSCEYYEKRNDCSQMDDYLWSISGSNYREGPHVFVRGEYLGSYKKMMLLKHSGKLQRIIDNLANFPPGASNYLEGNKSWNLAHEADLDILPDMDLKIGAREAQTVTVMVRPFTYGTSAVRVDCDHFANKESRKKDERPDAAALPTTSKGAVMGAAASKTSTMLKPCVSIASKSSMYLHQPGKYTGSHFMKLKMKQASTGDDSGSSSRTTM